MPQVEQPTDYPPWRPRSAAIWRKFRWNLAGCKVADSSNLSHRNGFDSRVLSRFEGCVRGLLSRTQDSRPGCAGAAGCRYRETWCRPGRDKRAAHGHTALVGTALAGHALRRACGFLARCAIRAGAARLAAGEVVAACRGTPLGLGAAGVARPVSAAVGATFRGVPTPYASGVSDVASHALGHLRSCMQMHVAPVSGSAGANRVAQGRSDARVPAAGRPQRQRQQGRGTFACRPSKSHVPAVSANGVIRWLPVRRGCSRPGRRPHGRRVAPSWPGLLRCAG